MFYFYILFPVNFVTFQSDVLVVLEYPSHCWHKYTTETRAIVSIRYKLGIKKIS